jgi:organic hydroperoxide reductase OsmC/OhrA/chorismate mutase
MSEPTSLEAVRTAIDQLDGDIVALLARRSACVKQAARFKRSDAEARAPARVEQVIAKVRALAAETGLEPQVAEATYRAMIAAFIGVERSAIQTATTEHHYHATIDWTGNRGTGASEYRAYSRDHIIAAGGKPVIPGSSDAAFLGDAARWNPEDLLVASLSACHQLVYLYMCAMAGIVVLGYHDDASGTMAEDTATGSGHFRQVILRPRVTIRPEDDIELARHLHHDAAAKCFIANSVNFVVAHDPVIRTA